jgi:prephenate dehydratase
LVNSTQFNIYNSKFKMVLAIQGIKGSYHHQVATNLYGEEIELIECPNFTDIPPLLKGHKADKAIMAIENTIAGAILPNYNLLDEFNLHILGEYYLPIQHQLMALAGQNIKDIREVWSHPMALEQCRKYFRPYPHIKLIEAKDTAEVAKIIQEKQLIGIAAIASVKAAEIYQLHIIADGIQTHFSNFTRFVILSAEKGSEKPNYNKASIKFSLSDQTGSLLSALQVLKSNNLNLSKIQSLPIIEKPWEYAFFADMIFTDVMQFEKAISELIPMVNELKIFGKYEHKNSFRI